MKLYKQCGLAQNDVRTVGWIEERGAKLGASVEIDGSFWEVIGVGDTTQTMEEIDRTGRTKMPSLI
ncbi:MAG: hypothetical protein EOO61_01470 [Hymenobacter sp.]|nr:MAG: hypothetical protein EOO61_01470 [Hymenobacter sp.]